MVPLVARREGGPARAQWDRPTSGTGGSAAFLWRHSEPAILRMREAPGSVAFGPPVSMRLVLCWISGLAGLRRRGCARLGTPGRSRGHREGWSCHSTSRAEWGRLTESSWNTPAETPPGPLASDPHPSQGWSSPLRPCLFLREPKPRI